MKPKILVSLFLLFSFYLVNAQKKVYMPFFEVLNIHFDYQYSISKLYQTYVNDINEYEIVLPPKADSIYPVESLEETMNKAQSMSAPFFIKGVMNSVGDVIIISIDLHQTSDGIKIWSDLLKAKSLEDLDPVIQRLARNLGKEKKSTRDEDIYTVTDYEAEELKEVTAKSNLGICLGGALPLDYNMAAGIGILATYDSRSVIFGFDGEIFMNKEIGFGFIQLDVDIPFKSTRNTGYLGGGLGYGFMTNRTDTLTEGGLMVLGNLGYIINRNSNVRLRLGIKPYATFFKFRGKTQAGITFYMALLFSQDRNRIRRRPRNYFNLPF
jgi:hypothetical protein